MHRSGSKPTPSLTNRLVCLLHPQPDSVAKDKLDIKQEKAMFISIQ